MVAVVLCRLTQVPRPRLVGWAILVTVLALLSSASHRAVTGAPPDDLLYRWSSAILAIVKSMPFQMRRARS